MFSSITQLCDLQNQYVNFGYTIVQGVMWKRNMQIGVGVFWFECREVQITKGTNNISIDIQRHEVLPTD